MAKICKECGVPRGTPHKDNCSGAAARLAREEERRASAKPRPAAVLVSRSPLKKAEMHEGLAVSRSTGRVAYHTPMDKAPPGMPQFEAPEPPVGVTDVRKLIDGSMGHLANALEGGTVEYMDPAIDAGEREPTENEVVVFRDKEGCPRLWMPLKVYNQFRELSELEPGSLEYNRLLNSFEYQPESVMDDGTVIEHKTSETDKFFTP
jgi:hypothetical protein